MRNRDPNRDPRRSPIPGDRAYRPGTKPMRDDEYEWIEVRSTIGMLMVCHNIREDRAEMLTMLDWDKLCAHESREARVARRGE